MESLALLKDKLVSGLSNIVSAVSTFMSNVGNWFSNMVSTIIDRFTELGAWFWELPGRIWEFFSEGLKTLFIPDIDFLGELKAKLEAKFPITTQLAELVKTLLGIDYSGTPVFAVNIAGQSITIIDFEGIGSYKLMANGIVIALAWYGFIRRTYSKLPTILGNVAGGISNNSGKDSESK